MGFDAPILDLQAIHDEGDSQENIFVPPAETFNLLQETGDAILQENGDNILLESAP